MDREHGTERLADASFLEELLRGRRTVVLTFGDAAPAQHLARRLGPDILVVEGSTAPGQPGGSADAVVALGGFQALETLDALMSEARRLLAPGGFLAVSWIDPSRPSLEALPASGAGATPALTAADATRRLKARFAAVAVVARQPYLGFQYVSGLDTQGALTLDSSLTAGGTEAPTGFLALASDAALPLGDALIQVPYDRAVARVAKWMREAAPAVAPPAAAPSYRQTVARPPSGGDEIEKLRAEIAALRDRAQAAVEEADRARGDVRGAKERAALLDAEVTKLRGRVRGIPEAEAEKLRAELAERTRERDSARRDAEGAAGEAARVLEAAANFERELEFLQARIAELERESGTLRAEKARAEENSGNLLRDARNDVRTAKAEADASKADAARAAAELVRAREESSQAQIRERALGTELKSARAELELAKSAAADTGAADEARAASALAAKRAKDFEERFREANAKLAAAVQKTLDLEGARVAAERSAEDAWKRLRDAQAVVAQAAAAPAATVAPAGDLVPAADLAAAERVLADAIERADASEKERRRLEEAALAAAPVAEASPASTEEIRELEGSLKTLREEMSSARRRADDAEARASSLERVADDARAKLEAANAKGAGADAEGLRSLVHQRETALNEARSQAQSADARAARFSAEAADAFERLKKSEQTLAERELQLKKALGAFDGVEQREQRDRELLAELKGEIARLTEAHSSVRDDLGRLHAGGTGGDSSLAPERDAAVQAAGMAQAEAARAHAEADALSERLEKATAELAELKGDRSKLDDQGTERERRIADLEARLLQLTAAGDSSSEMERRSVAMSTKLAHLEAELERAQTDVKQATAEARKYRALAEAIEPPADRSGGRGS